jgi:hypothetical protein
VAFVGQRMPIILGWEMGALMDNELESGQLRHVIASTTQFSGAADRVSLSIEQLPAHVSRERQAAIEQFAAAVAAERQRSIEQVNTSVTAQREALLKDLDVHEARIQSLVGSVQKTVDSSRDVVVAANDASSRTIVLAQSAGQSLMNRAFWLILVLLLVVLLGVPAVLLAYRHVNRRVAAEVVARRAPQA